MQLRIISVFVLVLLLNSCSSNIRNDEIDIIATVYQSIPKSLPLLPRELMPDSIAGKIDFSKREPIKHVYAINSRFEFKPLTINADGIKPISESKKGKNTNFINKELLVKNIGNKILFLNQQFITREEKKKHNVDGIISFSKASFNKALDRAAIKVGIYRAGLDSQLKIYILQKTEGKWTIKETRIVEYS